RKGGRCKRPPGRVPATSAAPKICTPRLASRDWLGIPVVAFSDRNHFAPASHAHVLNRHLPNSSVGYETPADVLCGLLTAERGLSVLHHRGDSLDGVRAVGNPCIVLEQHCACGLARDAGRGPR